MESNYFNYTIKKNEKLQNFLAYIIKMFILVVKTNKLVLKLYIMVLFHDFPKLNH